MMNTNLAIVDVETTGMGPYRNRIIEIAIIRVEKNKIVEKYTSLLNPEGPLPSFITYLTGITDSDLEDAPTFAHIHKDIEAIIKDAIIVAHNASFDYSFLRAEFERLDIPFQFPRCCTVRLSRRLFPQHRSHSLQSIIERYDFRYHNRHRAYDDAYVVWQFLKKIKREIPRTTLHEVWNTITV